MHLLRTRTPAWPLLSFSWLPGQHIIQLRKERARRTFWFRSRCSYFALAWADHSWLDLELRLSVALGNPVHLGFTFSLGLDPCPSTSTSCDLNLPIQSRLNLPIGRSDPFPFLLHPLYPRIRLAVNVNVNDPFPFFCWRGGIHKYHQTVFTIMYDLGEFFHDSF